MVYRCRKPRTFLNFTTKMDEMLIDLVESYPALYDPTNDQYGDHSHRVRAWHTIGAALDKSPEGCKTRWRSLKDTYLKKKRIGERPNRYARWPYMSRLSFLGDDRFSDKRRNAGKDKTFSVHILTKLEDAEETLPKFEGNEETIEIGQEIKIDSDNVENDIGDIDTVIGGYEETLDDFPVVTVMERSTNSLNNCYITAEDDQKTVEPDKICKKTEVTEPIIEIIDRKIEDRLSFLMKEMQDTKKSEDTAAITTFFSSMAETVKHFPPSLAAEAKFKVCQIITNLERQAHSSMI